MPSIAVTRPYEAIYIVNPDLGEEQVTAITDRYKQLIETNGGAVQKVEVWERRKLAYPIKGKNEGIYVVMHFTGEATVEAELRRIFQISEDQIRYMIVKPEEAPAATAPAAAAAPSTAAIEPTAVADVTPAPEATEAAPEVAPAPEATPAPAETEPTAEVAPATPEAEPVAA